MSVSDTSTVAEEIHYCTLHPDRETELQCNRCGRYMCVQCAVRTPVGYTCRQCVRGHEERFFNSTQYDYPILFVACAIANAIAAYIIMQIGFFLFVFLLAAPAGGIVSEIGLRLTGRRRGRYSAYVAAVGAVLGALVPLAVLSLQVGTVIPNISVLLYAGVSTAVVYGRVAMKFTL
jgi:hypothetical protein